MTQQENSNSQSLQKNRGGRPRGSEAMAAKVKEFVLQTIAKNPDATWTQITSAVNEALRAANRPEVTREGIRALETRNRRQKRPPGEPQDDQRPPSRHHRKGAARIVS